MNLTQREKQTIAAGAVLFGLIVAFQVFVKPAINRVRTLRRVVSDKQQLLGELRAKSEQYKAVSRGLEKIRLEMGRKPEERKILSFVERTQKDSGLMQKVVYMKPSTMTVKDVYEQNTIEIKLQSITLDQLIQFLLKIESSELTIGIRTLEIKRGLRDLGLLDTTIQLVSLSLIGSD
ncbi:MAG: type II secretion system protein M [Planctomycetes bacterium]|nr:type II secretion system protein M [Planctomycetota bacterium]